MRTARLPMFSTESVDLGWWTVKAGMNKNKQWKTQGRKRFGICTEQEFPAFTNEGKYREMKILPTWNSLSVFEVAEVVRLLKQWG